MIIVQSHDCIFVQCFRFDRSLILEQELYDIVYTSLCRFFWFCFVRLFFGFFSFLLYFIRKMIFLGKCTETHLQFELEGVGTKPGSLTSGAYFNPNDRVFCMFFCNNVHTAFNFYV